MLHLWPQRPSIHDRGYTGTALELWEKIIMIELGSVGAGVDEDAP